MPVYFAGSEPGAIYAPNSYANFGYDTNYSRCGVNIPEGASAYINLSSEIGDADANGWWLHFIVACANADSSGFTYGSTALTVLDTSANKSLELGRDGSGNYFVRLYEYHTSNYQDVVFSYQNIFYTTALFTVDVHCYTESGNAKAVVYVDGFKQAVVTYSSSNNVGLGSVVFSPTPRSNHRAHGISEVIVSDEDTRGQRVLTKGPYADGSHTDFSGGYANIDELEITSDSVAPTGTGDKYTFSINNSSAPVAIKAIILNGYGSSDSGDFQGIITIGGVDYNSTDLGFTGATEAHPAIWNTDPSTAAPWEASDISGFEFGWEAVA